MAELNNEQVLALKYIKEGFNIFLTGPAGCGKSFTIEKIVEQCTKYNKSLKITATTGAAASNIKGTTLHSWAGIGVPSKDTSIKLLQRKIMKNTKLKRKWRQTDVLIIDEVSMLDYEFMITLEKLARYVRNSEKVFGGIQIVLAGDFFQLPPVKPGLIRYIFEEKIWSELIHQIVSLTIVYRQKDDEYKEILMKIRNNTHTQDDIDRLNAEKTGGYNGGIVPTKLFCTRKDVDKMNANELAKLEEELVICPSKDFYENDATKRQYEKQWQFKHIVNLKIGAQVMLLTNMYHGQYGLVNGSRGIVTKIFNKQACRVQFLNGKTLLISGQKIEVKDRKNKCIASRIQLPLCLAWSLTVHKSQGQTIELLDIDLNGAFAPGQAYVALSRGVSLKNTRVYNLTKNSVKTNKKVVDFYNSIDSHKLKHFEI